MATSPQWYPGMVPIYTAYPGRKSGPPAVTFAHPYGGPQRTALFRPPNAATAPYPVTLPINLIPLTDFFIHLQSAAKNRKAIHGAAPNVFPFDVDYRPSMWLTATESVALSAFVYGLETLRSAVPEALESRRVWKYEPEYDTIATVLAEHFSTMARIPSNPSSAGIQPHTTSSFYAFLKPLALTSGISESLQKWYRLPTSINPKPIRGDVATFGAPPNIPANDEVLSDPKYGSPEYWTEAPYNLVGQNLDKWNGFHELLKEIFYALWVTLDSLRKPDDNPIPWKLENRSDIQIADTPQVLQTRILALLARLIGVYGMIPEKIREWLQRLSPYQDIMNEELLMFLDAYNLRIPKETQQRATATPRAPPKELDLNLPADLRVPENESKIAVTPIMGPRPTPTTPAAAAADSKYAANQALAAVNDAKQALARASQMAIRASIDSKAAAALASSTPGTPLATAFTGPQASPIPAFAATQANTTGFGSSPAPLISGGAARSLRGGAGKPNAFARRYPIKPSSEDWGL